MDPWDRAAPLDRPSPVDLETLQDPDLPTGGIVNQLNRESKQEYFGGGEGSGDRDR